MGSYWLKALFYRAFRGANLKICASITEKTLQNRLLRVFSVIEQTLI